MKARILKRRVLTILITLFTSTLLLSTLATSQDKSDKPFYLNHDSTAILSARDSKPMTTIKLMPDTVPEYLPRSRYQKFDNQRFHFLEVSPNGKYAAFAAGEGDQWMGLLAPEDRYMKFLLYSIDSEFFGARWSPDNELLAFAYRTPDRRFVVQMVRPPRKLEERYQPINAWQMLRQNEEQLQVIGWQVEGTDTTYGFVVVDSLGNEIQSIALPTFREAKPAPENLEMGDQ